MKKLNDRQRKILINFRKAQSLLETINKMVEGGHYCIDIMQQNLAVVGLLKSAHQMLMENHLQTCFTQAVKSKNQAKQARMIKEILAVTKLVNK